MRAGIGVCYAVILKRDGAEHTPTAEEVERALRRAADDDSGRLLSTMAVRTLSEWHTDHGHLSPPGGKKPASRKKRE